MQAYIPYVFMALALMMMARRTRVWRRVRPPLLVLVPMVILALAAFYAWGAQRLGPHITTQGWLAIAGGLAAGAACGSIIGRLVHLAHDPTTGHVTMRMSVLGALLLLALLVVRQGVRHLGMEPEATGPAAAFSLLSDVLLAMAVGMVLSRQFVLWRRWRTLVAGTVDTEAPAAA
ncbi:CcdC protein domain-containing protein [Azospirillum sp. B4]|uniref:CcdC protein domain-containing protein n=1 Tax=Azospirillum sp. B4 TaxID=95605 RepID=UPI00034B06AA|nr:CcdC protein domain-containing protein [Azospirillum sp. B4]